MMAWKTFLARAGAASALFGVAMFAAIRLATAVPGGPTRPEFTYSGVLRNRDWSTAGTITLTFTFTKTGGATCSLPPAMASVAVGGAFSVLLPLGTCASFFDGSDITYTVTTPGDPMPLAADVHVTPVPYARFADQVGVNNECPAGYARFEDSMSVVCSRTVAGGPDRVVKVGVGASAFWVDRYEASVWDDAGVQFGIASANYRNLSANGQWAVGALNTLRAVSRPGVAPSAYITWFQASAVCRAVGKRLLTGDEWFAAADGLALTDPPLPVNGNAPDELRCNTGGTGPRNTGGGAACQSSWGVRDMIGNLWEWTAEWYAGVGTVSSGQSEQPDAGVRWSQRALYNDDRTWNIASSAFPGIDDPILGMPSVALRGGAFNAGTSGGIFSLNLSSAPSNWSGNIGFRCMVPR